MDHPLENFCYRIPCPKPTVEEAEALLAERQKKRICIHDASKPAVEHTLRLRATHSRTYTIYCAVCGETFGEKNYVHPMDEPDYLATET